MVDKDTVDPRVAMLQIAVESLVESFKEQFEEYVRKIVVKVLDARDESLLEKLNKISEKVSPVDGKILEENYEVVKDSTWEGFTVPPIKPIRVTENELPKPSRPAPPMPEVKPAKGSWIEWDGDVEDECDDPEGLDGQTVVEVKFRNGVTATGEAGRYYWPHGTVPHRGDILAYRIVE